MSENKRPGRITPVAERAEVTDGGVVGSRYWLHSQPMPMVGRPCSCPLEKMVEQIAKLPQKPSVWCWTNSADNVPEGMKWLRSSPDAHAASVGPELDSWMLQNPNSWLVIDGRGERIPTASGGLEEILRDLPTIVVMIAEETNKALLFPQWDFPL